MENVEESRPHWLTLRNELIKELTKKDNIYSHLCDFAKATGSGAFKSKLRITGNLVKPNGQGPPKNISRITNISQSDLCFRAINIIEGFLPSCSWFDKLTDFSDDRPILGFLKDLDDLYFQYDRVHKIAAQIQWQSFRWAKEKKLTHFFAAFDKFSKEHAIQSQLTVDADEYWGQLYIALFDLTPPNVADGFQFFSTELLS